MKAVRFHNYGGSDQLVYEDAPKPTIGEDEILIRVFAAGVNPVDWKVREGLRKNVFPSPLPLIPGWDVSGTVEEIGKAVSGFKKGDEVFAMADMTRNGTYAEFVAIKASYVAFKPLNVDHLTAASVPLAALTAWQALFDAGKLAKGQKVLLIGASGGVGSFATQFARWKGAHVIAVASTKNVDFMRVLGAHEIIDYTTSAIEESASDIDLVFDMTGGDAKDKAWKTLKPGGTLVTIVRQPEREGSAPPDKKEILVSVKPNAQQLTDIAGLIEDGAVKPVVSTILPLQDAAKAQDALQNKTNLRGKIVLKVQGIGDRG